MQAKPATELCEDGGMSTTPARPDSAPEQIDPETERIVLERNASFADDRKTAIDARQALAEIRQNLKQLTPH